jgi:hypothetical protein
MQRYFDARLTVTSMPQGAPEALAGAILYGPDAAKACAALSASQPKRIWRHAGTLTRLIGPGHPDFPSSSPAVIDLEVPPAQLDFRQVPEDWRALCDACRDACLIRLQLAPGASQVAGARKLAKAFPRTRFLIDAYCHGPVPGWQAHICVAEFANVWLTTLGLPPGPGCCWPAAAQVDEALHFTIGEVGAGKLLFASGDDWSEIATRDPSAWLRTISVLNDAERELILQTNALELFANFPRNRL